MFALLNLYVELGTVNVIAKRLSFSLDDSDTASAYFAKQRIKPTKRQQEQIDIWTYCYVKRYFTSKLLRLHYREDLSTSLSELEEKVLTRVHAKSHTIKDPNKYSHWISVICKNTYYNYVRDKKITVPLDEELLEVDNQIAHNTGTYDAIVQVILEAIAELPDYLKEVAHYKFIEEKSYEEIAELTGKSIETLRSYNHKITKLLRENPKLKNFL